MAENEEGSSSNAYLEVKGESDKFIIVYTLIKLGLISGKVVIYTNTKDEGYRLKLFLEEFHIKTLILSYQLPKATRHLTVTNFVKTNDVLIVIDPDEKESENKDTKRHKIYKASISVLINFDFPSNTRLFKRRVTDISSERSQNLSLLSLIEPNELKTFGQVSKKLLKQGRMPFELLEVKMDQFEKFRYRCEDILKTVTNKKIKACQMNDVKKAILSAKEVKTQFETNPEDKKILAEAKKRHRPPRHLSIVPEYLMPEGMQKEHKPHKVNKAEFEKKLAKRQKREVHDVDEKEVMEETPENIAWQDLAPTSNRKLWKIRHHFNMGKRSRKPRRY